MPLRWIIDHAGRRVTATLLETTSEQEMYEFLGELIGQSAMPYAKLFDASAAIRWITPDRIGPIAATTRLYSRMGLGPVGPVAIVVASETAIKRAEEYMRLSDALRVVRLFARREDAEAWLESLPPSD